MMMSLPGSSQAEQGDQFRLPSHRSPEDGDGCKLRDSKITVVFNQRCCNFVVTAGWLAVTKHCTMSVHGWSPSTEGDSRWGVLVSNICMFTFSSALRSAEMRPDSHHQHHLSTTTWPLRADQDEAPQYLLAGLGVDVSARWYCGWWPHFTTQ